jgi:hypothetical protein
MMQITAPIEIIMTDNRSYLVNFSFKKVELSMILKTMIKGDTELRVIISAKARPPIIY